MAAGEVSTRSFVVVHRESLEAEKKCEITLGRWENEGSLVRFVSRGMNS